MIVSKKLLTVAIAVTLCTPLSNYAFFDDAYCSKNEKSHIFNFAQELRKQNSSHAQKVAQWLNQQCIDTSNNDNNYIIIADIVTNDQLTLQSKIEILSEIMAQQKAESNSIKSNNRVAMFCFTALFCFMCTIIAYDALFLEPHRPPRPVFNIISLNEPHYKHHRYDYPQFCYQ